jgi:high-affinity Fe2+/Pb2+ permease
MARLANPIPSESYIVVLVMQQPSDPSGVEYFVVLCFLALVVMLFIYEDGTVKRVVEMEE